MTDINNMDTTSIIDTTSFMDSTSFMDYIHPKFSIYTVLFSLLHGCYSGLYFLPFLQGLILVSGIIYHNKILDYKMYRYIDIGIVLFGLYYHISYYNKCKNTSYLFIFLYVIGMSFYFISLYTKNESYHCGVHILPVLGNIVLHKLLTKNECTDMSTDMSTDISNNIPNDMSTDISNNIPNDMFHQL